MDILCTSALDILHHVAWLALQIRTQRVNRARVNVPTLVHLLPCRLPNNVVLLNSVRRDPTIRKDFQKLVITDGHW